MVCLLSGLLEAGQVAMCIDMLSAPGRCGFRPNHAKPGCPPSVCSGPSLHTLQLQPAPPSGFQGSACIRGVLFLLAQCSMPLTVFIVQTCGSRLFRCFCYV